MHWMLRGVLFATAMVFGGIANACAFFILGRMRDLGFSVGFWRTGKDFKLYRGYWNIAPHRGWSRLPVIAGAIAFVLSGIFLFSSAFRIH
jgi:hypothetical protein